MGPFSEGWSEVDVEAVIARGNPDELLYVPIVVGMNAADFDREWAERICIALASHPNFNVRGNAILGFGHIARTCRALDTEQIVPLISSALSDPNEYVRDHADNAACDLQVYLRVLVPGYDTAKTEQVYETIIELQRRNEP
jgi:HEAT repeat protein